MKKSARTGVVVLAVVLVVVGAALFVFTRIFDTGTAGIYYTQVDNSRIKQNHPTGGVIDLTGGLAYSYTLPAYDGSGAEKEIEFGMSRQLREGAFLRLEVLPVRGVISWDEVQYGELPEAVQARYTDPADS